MSRLSHWIRQQKARPNPLRRLSYFLRRAEYPDECAVDRANEVTLDFVRQTNARCIAEVGIYQGYTSAELARNLNGLGELHLFDFEERVQAVTAQLRAQGFSNVVPHGNTHKSFDSYNWSLMQMLRQHDQPVFDYVYLDGAHTWPVDALAFFLLDRLLKVGGHLDFDDYTWSLEKSPTLNPEVFPATKRLFTLEQIREQHVRLIIELLVRRDARYAEVVPNKIFRKLA